MSKDEDFRKYIRKVYKLTALFSSLFIITGGLLVIYSISPGLFNFKKEPVTPVYVAVEEDSDKIENGIHVRTGLVEAEGLMTVVNNCTNCHSAKLVIQNRMNEERWNATIKWMQETQNLWDLGNNQSIIVNYLVTNYPPPEVGRRSNLTDIDWYELKD
ncbi:monoheme cytochrome C [Seonamhaeicola aphaedonensis]|uniref:Sulfite dehydrogenase (Cytochrome) subunit SorB n=1 Tax=Seonamhaeicola aphaedonensis TaxID=1461338 RepID=A0A3D9HG80_9FLAO|nr:monoheme cytochrome C [Seonamhaeicola aphaedonensis]RED48483.1 hypothetical protein DFQ02_104329 [Seonamhaeicola aphaedonensis]